MRMPKPTLPTINLTQNISYIFGWDSVAMQKSMGLPSPIYHILGTFLSMWFSHSHQNLYSPRSPFPKARYHKIFKIRTGAFITRLTLARWDEHMHRRRPGKVYKLGILWRDESCPIYTKGIEGLRYIVHCKHAQIIMHQRHLSSEIHRDDLAWQCMGWLTYQLSLSYIGRRVPFCTLQVRNSLWVSYLRVNYIPLAPLVCHSHT